VGKKLVELQLRDVSGASIVAIERGGALIQPSASAELHAGDTLFVDLFADGVDVAALCRQYDLDELPLSGVYFVDRSQEIGMAEVIVPATSGLIDKTVLEADFRARFGLTVIGIRRGTAALERNLRSERLAIGDTLLVIGPWKAIRRLQSDNTDLIAFNLPVELDEVLPVSGRALQAVFCLALVVALMISGMMPNVQAALVGCLLMGALGCVDLNSAYRSIDWKTIVLIVGMLPFSIALDRTGGVDLAAGALMSVVGDQGAYPVLATLFAVTALLGMFISNTATAVLMAPVALAVADDLNASPYPFAMIIALAASTAFMTPVSSPVNTLVVTPGNYTFGDFVKVGVPFSLIVLVVSVILVPWLLPL
jgi:di/tricarboxylate transporter